MPGRLSWFGPPGFDVGHIVIVVYPSMGGEAHGAGGGVMLYGLFDGMGADLM